MKRANADIDNKVLAGLIVGALTYALTKLAIPVDPQMEQLINVSAGFNAQLTPTMSTYLTVDWGSDTAGDYYQSFGAMLGVRVTW